MSRRAPAAITAATAASILLGACATGSPTPGPAQPSGVGTRTAHTPVSELAHDTTSGLSWRLVSFRDPEGNDCLTVDTASQQGVPACDIDVDNHYPANAAVMFRDNTAILYGRVSPAVDGVYSVRNGKREQHTIAVDPLTHDRYFAVIYTIGAITDVVSVSHDGTTYSLRNKLSDI